MDLKELRAEIDAVDTQIAQLFSRRMQLGGAVADYKREHSLAVMNSQREQQVLERVSSLVGEDLAPDARVLFASMMDMSKALQHRRLGRPLPLLGLIENARSLPKRARVCCQGVPGAFSQRACQAVFEHPQTQFVPEFEDVFQAVSRGECEFGILPIENSSAGSVTAVYDLMKRHQFYIARSVRVKVEHNLLVKPGTTLDKITDLYSHEQAISQCSQFLRSHPQITVHPYSNTAKSAQLVAQDTSPGTAAISSRECAQLYGLTVLESGIQNSQQNYTRFICITREPVVYEKADKVSVMLSIPHTAGSLYRVLSRFSYGGINLTKLESRPIPDTDFEFMFYFDLQCPKDPGLLAGILEDLQEELDTFVFLGAYQEQSEDL